VLARLGDPSEASARRGLDVAERVVSAAGELLLEAGGPSFTVPELAKRARTSLATLYTYFAGKDEVLLAVVEDVTLSGRGVIEAELAGESDPVVRLRHIVQRPILRTAESDGRARLIYFREAWRLAETFPAEIRALTDPSAGALQRALDEAVDAGAVVSDNTFRDSLNMRLYVWALVQAMQVGMLDDPDAVAADAWDFCTRALAIREPTPAL
jgi:AcrR family transcriptional regulator